MSWHFSLVNTEGLRCPLCAWGPNAGALVGFLLGALEGMPPTVPYPREQGSSQLLYPAPSPRELLAMNASLLLPVAG